MNDSVSCFSDSERPCEIKRRVAKRSPVASINIFMVNDGALITTERERGRETERKRETMD